MQAPFEFAVVKGGVVVEFRWVFGGRNGIEAIHVFGASVNREQSGQGDLFGLLLRKKRVLALGFERPAVFGLFELGQRVQLVQLRCLFDELSNRLGRFEPLQRKPIALDYVQRNVRPRLVVALRQGHCGVERLKRRRAWPADALGNVDDPVFVSHLVAVVFDKPALEQVAKVGCLHVHARPADCGTEQRPDLPLVDDKLALGGVELGQRIAPRPVRRVKVERFEDGALVLSEPCRPQRRLRVNGAHKVGKLRLIGLIGLIGALRRALPPLVVLVQHALVLVVVHLCCVCADFIPALDQLFDRVKLVRKQTGKHVLVVLLRKLVPRGCGRRRDRPAADVRACQRNGRRQLVNLLCNLHAPLFYSKLQMSNRRQKRRGHLSRPFGPARARPLRTLRTLHAKCAPTDGPRGIDAILVCFSARDDSQTRPYL